MSAAESDQRGPCRGAFSRKVDRLDRSLARNHVETHYEVHYGIRRYLGS